MLSQSIRGIDIGTGASAIYPLLGSRIFGWSFLGTDIDPISITWARQNVAANCLETQIECRQVEPSQCLLDVLTDVDGDFDFCMCNPPFFEDESQADHGRRVACMGNSNEMATEGGEERFVERIILDSLQLRDRVLWYSSMVGRKTSVKSILATLRERKITNVKTTKFVHGRTTRWGIAWTFGDVTFMDKSLNVFGEKKEVQRKNDHRFNVGGCLNIDEVIGRMETWFQQAKSGAIQWTLSAQDKKSRVVSQNSTESMYVQRSLLSGRVHENWRNVESNPKSGPTAETSLSSKDPDGAKKRKRDSSVVGVPVLFGFCVHVSGLSLKEDSNTCDTWEVTLSARWKESQVEERAARGYFWQFCDILRGEVTRSTRKWRRKLNRIGLEDSYKIKAVK